MDAFVRPYRPEDLDAVYDICVDTAAGGAGVRGQNSTDRLIGDIFAAPYVTREPEHAHVLDDGAGTAIGYVLGTADTEAFARWYRDEWLPATDYPDDPRDAGWLPIHRNPERMIMPELADYPAHLHIDVLQQAQGQGWGRRLMTTFLDGLAGAGVPRVHLVVESSNANARAFYARMGFHEIDVPEAGTVTFLGRETGHSPRR
jgi:ribosomal protein S18 acetylase RimI-like enzyme